MALVHFPSPNIPLVSRHILLPGCNPVSSHGLLGFCQTDLFGANHLKQDKFQLILPLGTPLAVPRFGPKVLRVAWMFALIARFFIAFVSFFEVLPGPPCTGLGFTLLCCNRVPIIIIRRGGDKFGYAARAKSKISVIDK